MATTLYYLEFFETFIVQNMNLKIATGLRFPEFDFTLSDHFGDMIVIKKGIQEKIPSEYKIDVGRTTTSGNPIFFIRSVEKDQILFGIYFHKTEYHIINKIAKISYVFGGTPEYPVITSKFLNSTQYAELQNLDPAVSSKK